MDTLLLQLTIDSRGAVRNPIMQPGQVARKPWGAFIYRRFDKVMPVHNAFLLRDDAGEWFDVSRVPRGVFLGFGAEISGADGAWDKTRSLFHVHARSSTLLTLRSVTELEIPAHHEIDPMNDPFLIWAMSTLDDLRAREQHLTQAIQALIDRQEP